MMHVLSTSSIRLRLKEFSGSIASPKLLYCVEPWYLITSQSTNDDGLLSLTLFVGASHFLAGK